MKQSQAVAYLLLHFSKRVKSNRRDSILASKTVRMRNINSFTSVNLMNGYWTLRSLFSNEHDFIQHICQSITENEIKIGILHHCSEIIVGKTDYPIEDLNLIKFAGTQFGLSENQIDNILHLVLCRESLCTLEDKELWMD